MNKLLACILLLFAFSVHAEEKTTAQPIPEQEKNRIARVLKDVLNDKTITQRQYEQAIVWLNSTPCYGVDRSLKESRKKNLASVISKKERLDRVDIFQSFKDEGWTIVYVNTYVSDETYFFYSTDPITAKHSVTKWSGAAYVFETSEIKNWVLKNAPGIPDRLASCFAWHVTLNRH
jgi:hypothetical protein